MGICLLVMTIVVLVAMKMMMRAGAMAIGVEYWNWRRACGSDYSSREFLIEILLIKWKKELHFQKGRLINKKSLVSVNQLVEQSTNNSILVFIISRGSSKSNMFYQIDQPQEHIGSEASSSYEDG
jgi:hypothetical protein